MENVSVATASTLDCGKSLSNVRKLPYVKPVVESLSMSWTAAKPGMGADKGGGNNSHS